MGEQRGTLAALAEYLAGVLQPLAERLSAGEIRGLLAELGLAMPASIEAASGLRSAAAEAVNQLRKLADLVDELESAVAEEDTAQILASSLALAAAVAGVMREIERVGEALRDAASGTGIPAEELNAFIDALPRRLLDYLLITDLERFPGAAESLEFAGALERAEIAESGPHHPAFVLRRLHVDELISFLADPAERLESLYGWGAATFDGSTLLATLARLAARAGLPAILDTGGPEPVLDMGLVELRPKTDVVPPGLLVTVVGEPAIDDNPVAEDRWQLRVVLDVGFELATEIVLQPGEQVTFVPADGEAAGDVLVEWVSGGPNQPPVVILGQPGGSRIEAASVRAAAGAELEWRAETGDAVGDLVLSGAITGGRVVLDLGDADGFLRSLFPDDHLAVDFDVVLVWSSTRGLHIEGASGLEAELPVDLQVGPVRVLSLHVGLEVAADGLAVKTLSSAAVDLDIATVTVDRVGAETALAFPDGGGNLGVADLSVGYKPPRGLGLTVDAGPLSGTGYLFFDRDEERYAGAVQLDVDGLALSAVGLLTTGLPQDAGRYSLLVLVSAADFAPVNLGFGFTLDGVGGLLGLNRAADTGELRSRLRGGGLDALAFPPDPLDGADELVGRLGSKFPPAPGRHLVGPAALIGWGTPTMLTIELVVALELPEPVRLVALAQLRARLPSKGRTLVRLNMDALGVVDFDRGRASLDAVLYDSAVVGQSIGGEMALRARWLGRTGFVLAVGGLNPRYEPPADFPELEPLSLTFERSGAEVRLEAYFALTTNTAQVGACLTVAISASRFTIDGMLQFDALIEFTPFRFVVDIAGRVRLRWGSRTLAGIYLEMTLAGPVPLHARGRARFKLGPLSLSASFDRTLDPGEPPAAPPPADPLPALLEALADPRSWSALPPVAQRSMVSLRKVDEPAVALHPLGELTVRQRVVPLEVRIERYGQRALAGGPRELRLTVSLPGEAPVEARTVTDRFAPAQFFELDDDDKLSAPAFQPLPSGVRLETPDAAFGGQDDGELMTSAPVGYDTRVVDDGAARDAAAYEASARRIRTAVTRRARTLAGSAHARGARYRGPELGLRLRDPVYVVARHADLRVDSFVSSGGSEGLSHTAAVQLLHRKQQPDQDARLQVVARHESVAAIPGLLPPGASPEEPGIYEERTGFGRRVPGGRHATMMPDSDPLPPTQAPGRRWQWVAPLDDEE